MGSFVVTCSLSDLPIPGGTNIRVLLLTENPYGDGWDLRAPPIRAVYDDYGGIQCVEPSDAPITDLWLKGLAVDMVERGVGQNTCHDVATRKGMSFDELVVALGAGRVMVRQDVKDFWRPPLSAKARTPKPWLPTMATIEAALGPELVAKLTVDAPMNNVVRLRRGGEQRYQLDNESLVAARLKLDPDYAVVFTAGYGTGGFDDELLVFAKPGKKRHYAGPQWDKEKLLRVRWAFVRSDVWEGLMAEKRPCWWGLGTMDEQVSRVVESYGGLGRILSRGHGGGAPHFTALASPGKYDLVKSMPGVIGLVEHLALLKLAATPEWVKEGEAAVGTDDVAHILDATAEMVHIHHLLRGARRAWAPMAYCRGAQDAEWKDQLRFMKVVMAVALTEKRRDDARMREYE